MDHSDAERRRSDAGASAVEYGLLFAAVVATVMLTVLGFSAAVRASFEQTATCLEHPERGSACTRTGVPASGGDGGEDDSGNDSGDGVGNDGVDDGGAGGGGGGGGVTGPGFGTP